MKIYAFFLDIQKAYDSVWHDGLWYKLWDMGVKGRMWRVIKKMYESTQSSCLIRSGILNHVEEGRGKCGVGWWMISLNLSI